MIILAVLGVLSVLMILNIQLSSDTVYTTKYLTAVTHSQKAYYLGYSAAKDCIRLLTALDDDDTDSYRDVWASPIPVIKVDEYAMEISVEDMERYFALNSIVSEGAQEEKHYGQLQRLMTVLELDPGFAAAILDWVDADGETTVPGGSETRAGSDRPVKNAPMDSIDELKRIEGYQRHIVEGSKSARSAETVGFEKAVCAYHSGKVNINTAGKQVLQSLDEEITAEGADRIIEYRNDKAIRDLSELHDPLGFSTDMVARIGTIGNLADVKSNYFRIKIEIINNEERAQLTAVVKREGGNAKVVDWRMD